MKRVLLILAALLTALLLVILIRTLGFRTKQLTEPGDRRFLPVDSGAVARLSQAIGIRTISYDTDPAKDDTVSASYSTFDSLYAVFRENFPLIFSTLDQEVINKHSLLLRWKGSGNRRPVILYAHVDVVPAEPSFDRPWTYEPFAGRVDEKFIYGRGTVDDKGSALAMMEATEALLAGNFTPQSDIYFAFGHDEEDTGLKGAARIAAHLKQKGVKAEFMLDEGGLIAVSMVPFVNRPVALIATSEKGYMTVELSVQGSGGHSSYPPPQPPVERIAKAIASISENPFGQRMTESVNDFLDYTGPEMNWPFRAIFANRWLFRPIVFSEYEKIPSANAMTRTTAVATVIAGGTKENVIPSDVKSKINIRILPGDKPEEIMAGIRRIINDTAITIRLSGIASEPSAVSSSKSESFRLLQQTIHEIFPDVVVAPNLLIGITDSRHFRDVTDNIYRFLPIRMNDEILSGMHGSDEKIGVGEYMEAIAFYRQLMQKL